MRLLFPVLLGMIAIVTACQGEGIESPPTTTAPQPVPKFDARKYGGPENFVINPSFEGRLKPWGPATYSSALRLTLLAHHDGKVAAEVVAREASPYGIIHPSLVGYPGRGDKFVLTGWVRTIGRQAVVSLVATESGGKAQSFNLIDRTFTVGPRWMRISARGTVAESDRTMLGLSISVNNSIAPGDRFLVDGVTFYRVPVLARTPRRQ